MTQGLARFHARSPRYFLNTEDESLIRVAGPNKIPWEEDTEIKNVSLTGLSFTAPEDLCPVLGEVIKIQFVVPGSQQMACHAIVTRLEPIKKSKILVAVHFYKLEMAHRIVLAQGLSKKIKPETDYDNELSQHEQFTWNIFKKISIMSVLLTLWLWLMFSFVNNSYEGVFNAFQQLFFK
ncbi:MAG: PilZ domain-containing protein [Bdellovibrionaceae bacterium]|nr:PilZ domain-containing protein [Pseudobdellovibrionaceae bacterium]NUM58944.1 PilZ domain-containing protein [Pseudobdellovibrionaceae bacterium]